MSCVPLCLPPVNLGKPLVRAGLAACAGPASRCPEAPLSALVDAGITSLVGVLGTDTVTRSQVTRALPGRNTACCGLPVGPRPTLVQEVGQLLPLDLLLWATGSAALLRDSRLCRTPAVPDSPRRRAAQESLVAKCCALRAEGLTARHWAGGYVYPPPTVTGAAQRDVALLESCVGVGEVAISDHRSSMPSAGELARLARRVLWFSGPGFRAFARARWPRQTTEPWRAPAGWRARPGARSQTDRCIVQVPAGAGLAGARSKRPRASAAACASA